MAMSSDSDESVTTSGRVVECVDLGDALRSLSAQRLAKGRPGAWHDLVLSLKAAEALLRPALGLPSACVWWRQTWARSQDAQHLLRLIREAVACAPAVAASANDETRHHISQCIATITGLVNDMLKGQPEPARWMALQEWVLREQGMLCILHAMLALLPTACKTQKPFAALDAAAELTESFSALSQRMSDSGVEALQRSSADVHGRFLRDSRALLRTYAGSANVQCLVAEWCKDLDRQIEQQEAGPLPSWYHVPCLVVCLPVLLFMPMVLPHLLRTMLSL